jgi:hypothetical protein
MQFNGQNHIASNVHQLQAGAITSIQNGLAIETTSQAIQTKVDTLNNYDDSAAQFKLDGIKAKTDTLVNTDLTGLALETTSQTIKSKVDSLNNYDDGALVTKVDSKPSLSAIEASAVLAKEATSQSIKTKVDSLSNTDLTAVNQDLTKIKQGINDASLLIPTNLT